MHASVHFLALHHKQDAPPRLMLGRGRTLLGSVLVVVVLATGRSHQPAEVLLAGHLATVLQAVRDDLRQVLDVLAEEATLPVPVVTALVRDEHDHVRVAVVLGVPEGLVGVLEVSGDVQLDGRRVGELLHLAVGVGVDAGDLAARLVDGRVPQDARGAAVVAHAAGVVDDDGDTLAVPPLDRFHHLGRRRGLGDLEDHPGPEAVDQPVLLVLGVADVGAHVTLDASAAALVLGLQVVLVGQADGQGVDTAVLAGDGVADVALHHRVAGVFRLLAVRGVATEAAHQHAQDEHEQGVCHIDLRVMAGCASCEAG